MCYPLGVWSSCGNALDTTTTKQCSGGVTGSLAPSTGALWVQSKFNLSTFLGQRVRIRWIAQSWEFDSSSSSYDEIGTWIGTGEEGWYLDDIVITGALQAQAAPLADTDTPAAGTCPTKACDNTQGDSGYNVALTVTQDVSDGVIVVGEKVTASAANTTNPGGCIGGGTQFRFFKDNVLVQDWSSTPSFVDNPSVDATYRVQARCSIDTTCTSSATATAASNSRAVEVFTGDGADIPLSVSHDRLSGVTTLSWPSRLQTPAVSGFDVFRGTQTDDGLSTTPGVPDTNLATLTSQQCNVPPGPPGTNLTATTSLQPAANTMLYFLVGHNPVVAAGQAALGRRGDGTLRPLAPSCP
jgi:hypothetical protein